MEGGVDKMKEKEIYRVVRECKNCGFVNLIIIPKGTRVDEFKGEVSCDYCRCLL